MREKTLTLIEAVLPRIENRTLVIVKDITLVFGFTVLTAICAKLRIEIGMVPITMQTFAVLLSGALMGSLRGAFSQIFYLLGGLAGIPWLARGGGVTYLISPTFGYLIGFVLSAYFVGWLCEQGFDRKAKTAILAILIGNILIYIPGLLWLAKFVGFEKVLVVGLYPFIPGDLAKLILASLVLPLAWKFIKKYER